MLKYSHQDISAHHDEYAAVIEAERKKMVDNVKNPSDEGFFDHFCY